MNQIIISLSNLRRGNTPYGLAPHKPILLLAVIKSFEKNEIQSNWIKPSDQLIIRFNALWKQLVKTQHKAKFYLPFFHLKNEPDNLWQLINFAGKDIPITSSHSIASKKALLESVAAAKLSEPLYEMMKDPLQRKIMRQTILSNYFPYAINKHVTESISSSTY